MRPEVVPKLLVVVCAAVVIFAGAQTVGYAEPDPECVDECISQYDTCIAQCEEALQARLAELDEEAEQCYDKHPNDLIALGLCLREVNIRRYRAQADYRRCKSVCNTEAWNCYLDCPPASESAP